MKKTFLILALLSASLFLTACQHEVTLAPGGAYSDANLVTTDQSILDASHTLTGFLQWYQANAVYLAKWPEVGVLASKVEASKDGWIRSAYAARDAYASAARAYASGAGPAPNKQQLNAALSLLSNITSQIIDYKTAHPHG